LSPSTEEVLIPPPSAARPSSTTQDEAGAYVDEHYPWDGRGDEPAARVSAYYAVLWQRVKLARS
jgi:hypothetical protein